MAIVVNAVNDAPLIVLPSAIIANEDIPLSIAGVQVSDIDASEGSGEVEVTLSVDEGFLTATGIVGVTVVGDGSAQLVGQRYKSSRILPCRADDELHRHPDVEFDDDGRANRVVEAGVGCAGASVSPAFQSAGDFRAFSVLPPRLDGRPQTQEH